MFFWIDVSGFLGYSPSSGIVGSKHSSTFSFLRKIHTGFHSGCIPINSALGFPFLLLYVPLGELSVQVLCPFFNWIVCLPGVESCEFFIYILEIKPLSEVSFANMFSHTVASLHFTAVFFSHTEAFYCDEIPFVYFFLYAPCFRGHIIENIAAQNIWYFPAYVPLKDFYGVMTYI